ncbi:methyl-accepting chemotaxis protein [Psychrosphaera ytuae]|uniref:Methyl-accepting chemotaxis protein n=1 Tax=Psychrosphaera ytuae TaxID=2820710 RepID=A0A975DDI7_9GAMM|nr:methyl-accepting chemotaxis protein [Psychrosphaera ytuae]QTH63670.1 methyl-accepting chemotaxis protein [Psychrosphaera ytuae]
MKLTVAMRVIGGFTITAVLLLILGFNSVSILDDISESTEQVNSLSVPALESSGKLQQQFLAMSKTTLLDYYATETSEVEATINTFNQQATIIEEEIARLARIVKDVPELRNEIPNVETRFNEFKAASFKLFDAKKSTLSLSDKILEQLDETEMAADDAASYILDFIDLNGLASNDPAVTAAARIEANMLSIITNINDLTKSDSRETVNTIRKEIDYIRGNNTDAINQFKTLVDGKDYDAADDIIEQAKLVEEMLTSSNSVGNIKVQLLDKLDAAARYLADTTRLAEAGIDELKHLEALVKEELAQTTNGVKESVSTGTTQNWLVMGIALVLSTFIGFKTVIRVTRPLSQVNEVLNVVSTGDLTVRLDANSKDEFGELAKNCNVLIDSLRELIHGIVNRSNQLATASEETSMVVKESTVAINEQRAQVEQAATATSEMASTSYAVMDRANEALADIKQADEDAERVKGISDNNKQTIIKLAGEIEQASGVIHEVNEHSAAIGGILDVIRGIAEQTNLLALNAAIEAARAGEQGRGFAVVADEVRSLASKTQESTEEIQSMIEQLQRGSKSAVTVMNNSKSQAELCVEQTEQATIALNSITDSVHQANDMSEQIVSAAQEQNQVSNEISERLESIVAIAEQTASGASQTDLSSQEVARLAEELRQSVEQFRL